MATLKVLITGANGMLGRSLTSVFAAEGHQIIQTTRTDLDITRIDQVYQLFDSFKPNLVLHTAALTDVDYCQTHRDEALKVNALGTQIVASACQMYTATMVYFSSLSVFDGLKLSPYHEYDRPCPANIYAESKYEGELAIASLINRYYIIRTGWLFGGGRADHKFVGQILRLASSKEELQVVDDKFGSPTYTFDLSRAVLQLVKTNVFGLYNLVNDNQAPSRYEIAHQVLHRAGIKNCTLRPVSSDAFPLAAPRPRMEAGINYKLDLIDLKLMRPWQEALEDYLSTFHDL